MRRRTSPSGPYAVIDGEEFPLFTSADHRYYAWSEHAREGFESVRVGIVTGEPDGFAHYPAPDEWLECVNYTYDVTYKGLLVNGYPNQAGRFTLYLDTGHVGSPVTREQARAAEFDYGAMGPDQWDKIVELDDPDLEFKLIRTPIDPPWMTNGDTAR
ncbi:hypothetical protein [Demequina sp. NBRC 110055]|uniref:hypothetical protein n=1 Tax=Demequina sp. NBRC 110055 TaxID=1570344 RepID=UPI0009FBB806|nr:hypothetical protein [Demequina sp. NBRC 110055]